MADLATRLRNLDTKVATRTALRDDRQRRVNSLQTEITRLEAESLLIEKTEGVLVELGKRTVAESSETLNKLTTLGLKIVFPDQELEVKTRIDRSRGKTAVSFELYDRGRTFPIDDAFGGGVLAIAGFLLRVSLITALKMRRIIMIDESFSHVAIQYRENTSKLLRRIADELGFTIIMVTHDPEYAQAAHVHLRASRKAGMTTITAAQKP